MTAVDGEYLYFGTCRTRSIFFRHTRTGTPCLWMINAAHRETVHTEFELPTGFSVAS